MRKQYAVIATISGLLSASPVFAFDCGKASTASEKAICADPTALASDTALSAAYKILSTSLSPNQSAELLKAQQNWVKQRDNNCGEQTTGAELSACLKDQSVSRMAYLTAKPEAGSGAPNNLVPFFQIVKGGKGKTNVDIQVYKFMKPTDAGQKAFNAQVDKLAADLQEPAAGDETADSYDYLVSMSLNYASPELISAHSETSSYFGGAHPNNQSSTININVKKGAVAKFKDFLSSDAVTKLSVSCSKQVLQQKKESQGADVNLGDETLKKLYEDIARVSSDLALWTFTTDKAQIQFDQYVVGAYSEGAFSCDIPYTELRPLVKKGFPLP